MLRLPSPPFVPGPDVVTEHLPLDPVPASVSIARRFVTRVLGPVAAEVRDTVLLLSSELVTNAILHAHTPVQVAVVLDEQHVLVCVADRLPGPALEARGLSRGRPGGRGLAMVADLSQQWGTTTSTGGKTVWFSVPLGGASSSAVRAG